MLARQEISGRHLPLKIAAHEKQGSAHHWKFSKCTSVCDLHTAFNLPDIYDYVMKLGGNKLKSCKIMRMNMFAV
jgi:hypothetical protein